MSSNLTSRAIFSLALAIVPGFTVSPWADAHAACNATVNGSPMSAELCGLATQKYGYVEPGHYWMDGNGNWGRVGHSRILGNIHSGTYRSRDGLYGGSGEIYDNGSWIHNQDELLGGGAVGGTGDGCIYTTYGWSNC